MPQKPPAVIADNSLRSLFTTAEYAGLYGLASLLPESTGTDTLSDIYKLGRDVLQKIGNQGMHAHALATFENPIPYVNRFIRNGWSFAHMLGGVTTTEAVYTYRHQGGTTEVPIYIKGKDDDAPTSADLQALGINAHVSPGDIVRNAFSKISENGNATTAEVYRELTDRDIREVIDPSYMKPQYMNREIWALCQHGKKTVVTTIADPVHGGDIIRYDRPSWAIAGHNLAQSLLYTAVDWAFEPFETYFSDLARQRAYLDEMNMVGKAAMRFESAGQYNPITYWAEYKL